MGRLGQLKGMTMVLVAVLILGLALPGPFLSAETPAFEARFEQSRTTPGLERAFESQGRVHWVSGEHLEWATESPFKHVYRLHSDRLVEIHDDGEKEETRVEDAPWVASINEMMMALVGGDREALEARFDIEELGEEDGASRYRLKPRDSTLAEQIKAMEVTQKRWPKRILIQEQDGGELDIRLAGHEGEAPPEP